MKAHRLLCLVLVSLTGLRAFGQENATPPAPESVPGAPAEPRLGERESAPVNAEGLIAFGLDLYLPHAAQLGTGDNLAISPACLGALLDALVAAADGKTEAELRRVLHYPLGGEGILAGSLIPASDPAVGLVVRQAMGLWLSPATRIRPEFLATLKERFGATAETVDFAKGAEAAGRINSWVSEQTEGKIPTLVAPAEFSEQSRLAAVSALYFKAPWADHFDLAKTKPGAFRPAAGKPVTTPMMQGKLRGRYTEWPNGTKALGLDFQGGTLTFLALLPPDTKGALPALEASLTPDFLRAIAGALKPDKIDITLPRFSISASTPPRALLMGLGVDTLFREADFSRMTSESDLVVSSMNHRVSFAVDEAGAEGAAAASGVVTAKGMVIPKSFVADRPFVFLVLHRATLAPLIIGRLANPVQTAAAAAATPRPVEKAKKK